MAEKSSNDTAAAPDAATADTESLLQMVTDLLENTAKGIDDPSAANDFLQLVLQFIADWKLVNTPTNLPDMATVFGQAEAAQATLNQFGATSLKTGVVDIYAYGGAAAENAIAVLMESVKMAPQKTEASSTPAQQ